MFCDPRPQTGQSWYCGYWLLWTSTTFASLYAVCGFLHLEACASGWVQNGSPTPHKTGCKLTLELQLFLFLASSHFHVGIGSFCENGLWRRMYLEKPISLEQGPLPAPSFSLEEFCWNLLYLALGSVEREPRRTARPSCRLTTMLILTALQHAGLHQGLWVPRPVAGNHTTKGQKLQGKSYPRPLRDASIPQ